MSMRNEGKQEMALQSAIDALQISSLPGDAAHAKTIEEILRKRRAGIPFAARINNGAKQTGLFFPGAKNRLDDILAIDPDEDAGITLQREKFLDEFNATIRAMMAPYERLLKDTALNTDSATLVSKWPNLTGKLFRRYVGQKEADIVNSYRYCWNTPAEVPGLGTSKYCKTSWASTLDYDQVNGYATYLTRYQASLEFEGQKCSNNSFPFGIRLDFNDNMISRVTKIPEREQTLESDRLLLSLKDNTDCFRGVADWSKLDYHLIKKEATPDVFTTYFFDMAFSLLPKEFALLTRYGDYEQKPDKFTVRRLFYKPKGLTVRRFTCSVDNPEEPEFREQIKASKKDQGSSYIPRSFPAILYLGTLEELLRVIPATLNTAR